MSSETSLCAMAERVAAVRELAPADGDVLRVGELDPGGARRAVSSQNSLSAAVPPGQSKVTDVGVPAMPSRSKEARSARRESAELTP